MSGAYYETPFMYGLAGTKRVHGDLETVWGDHRRRGKGSARPGRLGLWYRHRYRWPRRIRWAEVTEWSVGRDGSEGITHTHALIVASASGRVVLRVRGPAGALAVVRIRESIRRQMRKTIV